MAKLVSIGETLVGIALILGMFTGFAAFFGGFMNFNYLMAGAVSVNPMFLVLSVTLLLAWKVSGYIGLDYFLVPHVGALWSDRISHQGVPERYSPRRLGPLDLLSITKGTLMDSFISVPFFD